MKKIRYRHDNGRYYSRKEYGTSSSNYANSASSASSYRSRAQSAENFNRILLIILIALIVIFVGGTAVSIAKNGGEIKSKYRHADPTPKQVINTSLKTNSRLSAYTDVGQIRTVTKGSDSRTGILLLVSPWFSYQANDTALFEELAQKDKLEKSIIIGFFSEYTKDELLAMGEQKIKEDIKNRINNELVLGKIKDVYFDQYLFFE